MKVADSNGPIVMNGGGSLARQLLNEEACWEAVLKKDKTKDGEFFFGVLTTGVFCRLSCPARRPLRKNIRFYETATQAIADNLRPCLRCRPLVTGRADSMERRIYALCDFIRKNSSEPLNLEQLSQKARLSPFHLQRTFKAVVGVTPRQYLEACRLETLKKQFRSGNSLTEAIYDAGFGSNSRVYERVSTRLGMTPTEYRAGGNHVSISYVTIQSPLGLMMIGATDRGLCFVQFGDSRVKLLAMLRAEFPAAALAEMKQPYPEQFGLWVQALIGHLSGDRQRLSLPVDVRGTAFQFRVWTYLQSIPYGEVQSYSEVARGIQQPGANRAVAQACASNKVAIAVPCHRVIRGNGEMGGYRWGVARKRTLIDLERSAKAAEHPLVESGTQRESSRSF
jgi:AraC family transcriptional regulator, regulatory protein of adaptative response / methylated-DNA-[protein]-cysteine methyltransferase